MIRYLVVAILVFLAWRCSAPSSTKTPEIEAATENIKHTAATIPFLDKVYYAGDRELLTDSCTLPTDCDCCHDKLILRMDSTVYFMTYCENSTQILSGVIRKASQGYEIVFDGEIKTVEVGQDGTEDRPYSETTKSAPFVRKLHVTSCNNLTQLIFTDTDKPYVAVQVYHPIRSALEEWNTLDVME